MVVRSTLQGIYIAARWDIFTFYTRQTRPHSYPSKHLQSTLNSFTQTPKHINLYIHTNTVKMGAVVSCVRPPTPPHIPYIHCANNKTDHRPLPLHRSMPHGYHQRHRLRDHGHRRRRAVPLQSHHHLSDLWLLRPQWRESEDDEEVEDITYILYPC